MCRLYFSLICLLLITSSTFASLSVDTVVKRIRINRELLNIGIISDAQFPENDENLSVGHLGVVMNGPKHVHRALNYFKKMSVDMIIMNGDMLILLQAAMHIIHIICCWMMYMAKSVLGCLY